MICVILSGGDEVLILAVLGPGDPIVVFFGVFWKQRERWVGSEWEDGLCVGSVLVMGMIWVSLHLFVALGLVGCGFWWWSMSVAGCCRDVLASDVSNMCLRFVFTLSGSGFISTIVLWYSFCSMFRDGSDIKLIPNPKVSAMRKTCYGHVLAKSLAILELTFRFSLWIGCWYQVSEALTALLAEFRDTDYSY